MNFMLNKFFKGLFYLKKKTHNYTVTNIIYLHKSYLFVELG